MNIAINLKFTKIALTNIQKLSHTAFKINLLTHLRSMFPSYDNQLIRKTNQPTGFHMTGILALKDLEKQQ